MLNRLYHPKAEQVVVISVILFIERTENYTDDTVEWVLTPRTWFPKSIDDAQLVCVASWASTGKYAGINVSYQGVVNIGPNSQYPTSAGYTEIPVRFSYSD